MGRGEDGGGNTGHDKRWRANCDRRPAVALSRLPRWAVITVTEHPHPPPAGITRDTIQMTIHLRVKFNPESLSYSMVVHLQWIGYGDGPTRPRFVTAACTGIQTKGTSQRESKLSFEFGSLWCLFNFDDSGGDCSRSSLAWGKPNRISYRYQGISD